MKNYLLAIKNPHLPAVTNGYKICEPSLGGKNTSNKNRIMDLPNNRISHRHEIEEED